MRFITGKHRLHYETLVAQAAKGEVATLALEKAEKEIARLLGELSRERARAERAIDAQLSVRGFPPVTPPDDSMPEFPDALAEDPEKVAALEKRILAGDASVFTERF